MAGVAPPSEVAAGYGVRRRAFYSPARADLISGQLYKYNPSTEQPSAKLAQATAHAGGIGWAGADGYKRTEAELDTAADSFKYCVALVAESAARDRRREIPRQRAGVQFKQCAASDGPNPQNFDLAYRQPARIKAMVQADLTGRPTPRHYVRPGRDRARFSFDGEESAGCEWRCSVGA